LTAERREQINGWKSFVHKDELAQDEHGHGSQMVYLAMRMAPQADIYVARVIRNRSEIRTADDIIAGRVAKVCCIRRQSLAR
jgi:hypothetical protein